MTCRGGLGWAPGARHSGQGVSCAKTRRNARKARTVSAGRRPCRRLPLRLLEGRKPDGFDGSDPSGDGHRATGSSGARKLGSQPDAYANGTGLEEEPSLRQTTGDPLQGGDPTRRGFGSEGTVVHGFGRGRRVRTLFRGFGRGAGFGHRVTTGNRRILDRSERKFTSARIPRGRDSGRASSGFFASEPWRKQDPAIRRSRHRLVVVPGTARLRPDPARSDGLPNARPPGR